MMLISTWALAASVSGIGLGPLPHFLRSLAQLCKVGVAMPNLEMGKQSSRLFIIRISN